MSRGNPEWWVQVVEGLAKRDEDFDEDKTSINSIVLTRSSINSIVLARLKRRLGYPFPQDLIDSIQKERKKPAPVAMVNHDDRYDNLVDHILYNKDDDALQRYNIDFDLVVQQFSGSDSIGDELDSGSVSSLPNELSRTEGYLLVGADAESQGQPLLPEKKPGRLARMRSAVGDAFRGAVRKIFERRGRAVAPQAPAPDGFYSAVPSPVQNPLFNDDDSINSQDQRQPEPQTTPPSRRGSKDPLPLVPISPTAEPAKEEDVEMNKFLKNIFDRYNAKDQFSIALVKRIAEMQQEKRRRDKEKEKEPALFKAESEELAQFALKDLQQAIKEIKTNYETLPSVLGGNGNYDTILPDYGSVTYDLAGAQPAIVDTEENNNSYDLAAPRIRSPLAESGPSKSDKITNINGLEDYFKKLDQDRDLVAQARDPYLAIVGRLSRIDQEGGLQGKEEEVRQKLLDACVTGLTSDDFTDEVQNLFQLAEKVYGFFNSLSNHAADQHDDELFEEVNKIDAAKTGADDEELTGESDDFVGDKDDMTPEELKRKLDELIGKGEEDDEKWSEEFIKRQIQSNDPYKIVEKVEDIARRDPQIGLYDLGGSSKPKESAIYDNPGEVKTAASRDHAESKVTTLLATIANMRLLEKFTKDAKYFSDEGKKLSGIKSDNEDDVINNIVFALINNEVDGAKKYCDDAFAALIRLKNAHVVDDEEDLSPTPEPKAEPAPEPEPEPDPKAKTAPDPDPKKSPIVLPPLTRSQPAANAAAAAPAAVAKSATTLSPALSEALARRQGAKYGPVKTLQGGGGGKFSQLSDLEAASLAAQLLIGGNVDKKYGKFPNGFAEVFRDKTGLKESGRLVRENNISNAGTIDTTGLLGGYDYLRQALNVAFETVNTTNVAEKPDAQKVVSKRNVAKAK